MAAAKITPNFPGAYSGQVDTWEEEMRDQIKLLPAYGCRGSVVDFVSIRASSRAPEMSLGSP